SGDKRELLAWIGPHISSDNYEVGEDVYKACIMRDKELREAFTEKPNGRWNASLEYMIRKELSSCNVTNITSSGLCTYKMSK
ncbi:MAG: hypothetical protein GTO60_07890, partial [Gammaproteobacteria bacterium]|nr:hypothetical protein [Gammaproteobacteria bacterium]